MSLCAACGSEAGDIAKFCPSCGASVHRGAAPSDSLIGRIIAGKFRIESLLGEGGMGMVYKATQVNLEKTVVLKVLRPSLVSDERTVQRFQREARAASRLNHPNSIAVIDFGESSEDGSMYIAMEYCAGHDLHHIIGHEWPLEEARIVRIVSQVLSALAEAHAHGVIHRDLKPENIMVEQRRGEPDFVKVLDFGIAKITDTSGEEGQALTRAGFVCGTPEYMSPEQARGAAIDQRSDLYAVGVLLYQLVTGLLPFDSDSAVGFATAHLTQAVPPIRKRRPEARCSPALEALIMRALAKDAAQRPQSADAFRTELLSFVPAARPPGMDAMPRDDATAVSGPAWNDRTPAEPNRNIILSDEKTRVAEPTVAAPRSARSAPVAREPAPAAIDTATATATAPHDSSDDAIVRPSAARWVLGLSAVGLVIAAAFFAHEYFLKPQPVATVFQPIPTQQAIVDPPKKTAPPIPHPAAASALPSPADAGPQPPDLVLTDLTADPKAAAALDQRAKREVSVGNFSKALALAQQAYNKDSKDPSVMTTYADVAFSAALNDPSAKPTAINLYEQIRKLSGDAAARRHAAMQLKLMGVSP